MCITLAAVAHSSLNCTAVSFPFACNGAAHTGLGGVWIACTRSHQAGRTCVLRAFGDNDSKVTDPYVVLGVRSGADVAEIRRAFRRRARELHPDVSDAPDAAEKFRALVRAATLLLDPNQRAGWDALGKKRAAKERAARAWQSTSRDPAAEDPAGSRREWEEREVEASERRRRRWREVLFEEVFREHMPLRRDVHPSLRSVFVGALELTVQDFVKGGVQGSSSSLDLSDEEELLLKLSNGEVLRAGDCTASESSGLRTTWRDLRGVRRSGEVRRQEQRQSGSKPWNASSPFSSSLLGSAKGSPSSGWPCCASTCFSPSSNAGSRSYQPARDNARRRIAGGTVVWSSTTLRETRLEPMAVAQTQFVRLGKLRVVYSALPLDQEHCKHTLVPRGARLRLLRYRATDVWLVRVHYSDHPPAMENANTFERSRAPRMGV